MTTTNLLMARGSVFEQRLLIPHKPIGIFRIRNYSNRIESLVQSDGVRMQYVLRSFSHCEATVNGA